MLEISIPRDVRDFQPKFMGPFTERQCAALAAMIVVLSLTVLIQKNLLGFEVISYIPGLVLASPAILFGWGDKVFQMPFEVYARTVFLNAFVIPKHRVYQIHCYYSTTEARLRKEMDEAEAATEEGKEKAKNKEKSKKKVANPDDPNLIAYL